MSWVRNQTKNWVDRWSTGFMPVSDVIPKVGLQLWLDSSDSTTITKAYQNLVATGSGTSGTTTITASATVANLVQPGFKLRIGGTDIYTVSTVSTVTITTVETLSATYPALSAMALDRVSQWNDKSGLGNHATQATALTQPVYNPARLNSQAVLAADKANLMSLPAAIYTIPNGNNTMFLVGNVNIEGDTSPFIGMTEGGGGRFYLRTTGVAGQLLFQSKVSDAALSSTGNTLTNYNIVTAFRSGATQSLSVNNGTAVTDGNGLSESGVDAAKIFGSDAGGGTRLLGNIALILLYNRALSASEIIQVNRWIAGRTAITIS